MEVASQKFLSRTDSCDDGSTGQILQGLPNHIAMECLARVPLSTLRRVSKAWRSVIYDPYFQSLRALNGRPQLYWLYTLVQTSNSTFKWRAFDPLAWQWHDLPPTPHPMEFQLFNPGCIGVSYAVQCASTTTKLVMVAGLKVRRDGHRRTTMEPALEHPFIFDTRTGSWSQGSPFRVPRKWCVCGVTEEKLFVASGSGAVWDRDLSMAAEVYDLESHTWERLHNLSSSKFSGEAMTAIAIDRKLYFVSGSGVFSKEGVVYDLATDSWSEMPQGLKHGWTDPCVAVNGVFYLLESQAGKLKMYATERDEWDVVLEDPRLQNLEVLVGTNLGKIVAVELAVPGKSTGSSLLRVIDINLGDEFDLPQIFDISVLEGQVVSVQVLAMMSHRP